MARSEVYPVDPDQIAYSQWKREGRSDEEAHQLLRDRLENQIPAYLGEFILGVRFKEFYYEEKIDPITGKKIIGAPGFVGDIGESYHNAIADAKSRGWSGRRETAESDAFNKKLKPRLFNSPAGTFYLWISPPGSKAEGYGSYSFTHIGQIQETPLGRRYKVTSIRNTLELKEHAAIINQFLPEGEKLKNPSDIDFLNNPAVIANEGEYTIHDLLVAIDVILRQKFRHKTHLAQAYLEKEDWEEKLRKSLSPMIDDYCLSVENGYSRERRQKIFWMIENYTEDLIHGRADVTVKEGSVSVRDLEKTIIYQRYGHEPKALSGGSCPPNRTNPLGESSLSSARLPWQEHQLENLSSSEGKKILPCECPVCHKQVEAVIENGKIHCPSCGTSADYHC